MYVIPLLLFLLPQTERVSNGKCVCSLLSPQAIFTISLEILEYSVSEKSAAVYILYTQLPWFVIWFVCLLAYL